MKFFGDIFDCPWDGAGFYWHSVSGDHSVLVSCSYKVSWVNVSLLLLMCTELSRKDSAMESEWECTLFAIRVTRSEPLFHKHVADDIAIPGDSGVNAVFSYSVLRDTAFLVILQLSLMYLFSPHFKMSTREDKCG